MALEIEFLDGPPVMEIGASTRIKVRQRDADGELNPMLLKDVAFTWSPHEWGAVRPTSDPAVGTLEVIRMVESEDLLLAPTYSIAAKLTHTTGQTFQSERRVRLVATAIEVELQFEVGQYGKFRGFHPKELRQPIDWKKARTSDPATQTIVIHDGLPYLRLSALSALPARVEITMPNGEVATITIEGDLLAWRPGEAPARKVAPAPEPVAVAPAPAPAPPAPAPAPAPAPTPLAIEVESRDIDVKLETRGIDVSGAAAAAAHLDEPAPQPGLPLRDEVARLRRYLQSFAGTLRTARPDPRTQDGIRQRVAREVERVRALIDLHTGPDRDELLAGFQQAIAAGSPVVGGARA